MNWNGFFVKRKDEDGQSAKDTGALNDEVYEDFETQDDGPEDGADTKSVPVDEGESSDPGSFTPQEENNEGLDTANCALKSETKEASVPLALCEFDLHVRLKENGDVGRAALYLAMSEDIADEKHVKESLQLCGWKAVATEIGGISGNITLKASRAIVGAALNSGVVKKTPSEMHALMHAAQEAFAHFIPDGLIECSVGAKIAIVRNAHWLAVAVSGDTAYHAIAHHERVGVGVMHI